MPRSYKLVLWFPLCNNLCFLGPLQLQRQLSRRPERQKVLRKHTWKARRDAQTWRSRNKVTQAPFQIAPLYFPLSLLIDYIRDEYVHTSVYLVNPMSPLVNVLTSFPPDIDVRGMTDCRQICLMKLRYDIFEEFCQNCLEFETIFLSCCDPTSNMCARSICTKFDPFFTKMYQQMTGDIRICRIVVLN